MTLLPIPPQKCIITLGDDMNRFNSLPFALFIALSFFNCATNNASSINAVYADEVNERYVDIDGGFSILPPDSWQVREWPGLKYKVIIGPTSYEFNPNINFVDENYNGQLNDYVDANMEALKRIFRYELIQRNEFITTKNLKGEKVIIHSLQNERYYRQIFYFFTVRNGRQLLATCTVPLEAGDIYDELFDKTMKTFESIN
jgi:hypothetical protein